MKIVENYRTESNEEAIAMMGLPLFVMGTADDGTIRAVWTREAMYHFKRHPEDYAVAQKVLKFLSEVPFEKYSEARNVGQS